MANPVQGANVTFAILPDQGRERALPLGDRVRTDSNGSPPPLPLVRHGVPGAFSATASTQGVARSNFTLRQPATNQALQAELDARPSATVAIAIACHCRHAARPTGQRSKARVTFAVTAADKGPPHLPRQPESGNRAHRRERSCHRTPLIANKTAGSFTATATALAHSQANTPSRTLAAAPTASPPAPPTAMTTVASASRSVRRHRDDTNETRLPAPPSCSWHRGTRGGLLHRHGNMKTSRTRACARPTRHREDE